LVLFTSSRVDSCLAGDDLHVALRDSGIFLERFFKLLLTVHARQDCETMPTHPSPHFFESSPKKRERAICHLPMSRKFRSRHETEKKMGKWRDSLYSTLLTFDTERTVKGVLGLGSRGKAEEEWQPPRDSNPNNLLQRQVS
jgi:hypothetical protein